MKKLIRQCRESGVEQGDDESLARLARLATAKLFAGLSGDDQAALMDEREYALGAVKGKVHAKKRARVEEEVAKKRGGDRRIAFDEELETSGSKHSDKKKKGAKKGEDISGFSDFIKSVGMKSGASKAKRQSNHDDIVDEDMESSTLLEQSADLKQLHLLQNTNPMNLSKQDATKLRSKIKALESKIYNEKKASRVVSRRAMKEDRARGQVIKDGVIVRTKRSLAPSPRAVAAAKKAGGQSNSDMWSDDDDSSDE